MSKKPRLFHGRGSLEIKHSFPLTLAAPPVEFSYHSDGRLVIQCGDDIIALAPDDVTQLKSFMSQINMGGEGQ